MQNYKIKSGDTLSKIAVLFFNDAQKYKLIAEVNNIKNPNSIQVGQVLRIPLDENKNNEDEVKNETPKSNNSEFIELRTNQLKEIMPYSSEENRSKYIRGLNEVMKKYEIDTKLRQAHFLAQLAHESGSLRYSEEIASGKAYEGRKDLGNVEAGDGVKFKGRGLMQLTGRSNYERYSKYIDINLLDNPERLSDEPLLATDVAGWFWSTRGLNKFADEDNIREVTRRINGGYNGLEDREAYLKKAKQVFDI